MLLDKIKKRVAEKTLPPEIKKRIIFHSWIRFSYERTGNLKNYFAYQDDRLDLCLELRNRSIEKFPWTEITEDNEEKILFYLLKEGFKI